MPWFRSLISPSKPPPPPPRFVDLLEDDPIFDYQFRYILIGDSTVGKSSLLRSFTQGTFAEISDPTVGVDFYARLMRVSDGCTIKLQLWDTAGQERFRAITKYYYRNSVGGILAFDICCRESFAHIPVWLSEARKHIEPYKACFILVGCKSDAAVGKTREVSTEEARKFAEENGLPFFETSSRSGENIHTAFQALTQQIYDKIQTKEYIVDPNWDGIKTGYFAGSRSRYAFGSSRANLALAEPVDRRCC